ncbi:MAG: hypothetical protein JWO00_592 [Candidatus Parcubacteria bacterium]|nr:hypothetical protein [Candidatus Parcubacteria bacterium]
MKYFRLEKAGSFTTWRILVNFWSVVLFAAIIYDFFTTNSLSEHEILLAISAIYGAALAIYSAEKEFRRWHRMHTSLHPGELYAVLWTILIVALIVGTIAYNPSYHLPAEVSAAYIGVIGILAITRESKNFYRRREKK